MRDQPGVKEQVGIYLDESVISLSLFTPDVDLFDTNRVQVLRGPQGALFGSGSVSGTVRYITNQPMLGTTKGFAEFDLRTVAGNLGGDAKVGFNVPLTDKAALRVASWFGEATFEVTDRFSLTGGLRYYHFEEDKEQIFDGILNNDNTGRRSCRSRVRRMRTAWRPISSRATSSRIRSS